MSLHSEAPSGLQGCSPCVSASGGTAPLPSVCTDVNRADLLLLMSQGLDETAMLG